MSDVTYTNITNIPIGSAVWLCNDTYDHTPSETEMSVTTLIKPIKQTVMASRIQPNEAVAPDVSQMLASRRGTAIHDSIEFAWLNNKDATLKALGFTKMIRDAHIVNPDPKDVTEDDIPVYLEIRGTRTLLGIDISGKFDFLYDGQMRDFKTTSSFKWKKQHAEKQTFERLMASPRPDIQAVYEQCPTIFTYVMQGSIYKWLNQDKCTKPTMCIEMILGDYRASADGPPSCVVELEYTLFTPKQTEKYLTSKLQELMRCDSLSEDELPECTPTDLWQGAPTYKYYSKEDSKRATKTFESYYEAQNHMNGVKKPSGTGYIKTFPAKAMACVYCPARPTCKQAAKLEIAGAL